MSVSRHGLVFLALLSVCLALVSQPDFAGDSIRIRDLEAKASTLNARDNVPAGFVAAPYYPAPPGGESQFNHRDWRAYGSLRWEYWIC